MKRIKRRVIGVRNYVPLSAPHGGSSNVLTLECGHQEFRKNSRGIPKFVYCLDCERSCERKEAQ